MPRHVVPLALLNRGESGVIAHLRGGQGLRRRVGLLGATPGRRVEVLEGGYRRAFVIGVEDARIMIGWRAARHIMVDITTNGGAGEHKA